MNKNLSRQVVFAAVVLLALGCAAGHNFSSFTKGILTFESGTPSKREEVAYIFSGVYPVYPKEPIGVLNVDGVKIGKEVKELSAKWIAYGGIIELKPGTHSLTLIYNDGGKYSQPMTSTVEVRAGRLYKFAAGIKKEGDFWKGKLEILSDLRLEDVTGQAEYESRFNRDNILPRKYILK